MNKRLNETWLKTAAAALWCAAAGCSSGNKHVVEEPSADLPEHNRTLVRMMWEQNICNGIAAERAVYPKDFAPGSTSLNDLGERRVNLLMHSSRGAAGRIVVIRGNESQPLYDARVAAVRQHLADAGMAVEQITVTGGDHVEAGGISSAQAILAFDRMLSTYVAKPGGPAAAAGMQSGFQPSPISNNGSQNK